MLEWTRFPVGFHAAAEPDRASSRSPLASIESQPTPHRLDKTLPVELVLVTPAQPSLYPRLTAVEAPASVAPGGTLEIDVLPGDDRPALGEPWVFAKDNQLHIFIQDDGRLPKNVTPVDATDRLTLSLGADVLAPGEWTAALYTAAEAGSWTVTAE
jgi:hypothetical protein